MFGNVITDNAIIVLQIVLLTFVVLVTLYAALSLYLNREKRLRTFKALWNVLALLIIPGALTSITTAVLLRCGMVDHSILRLLGEELSCYGMLSIANLVVFGLISKDKGRTATLIAWLVGSLVFTAESFFVNNALKAAEWSRIPGCPTGIYMYILREDLRYTGGLGIFRYVIFFLIQLALFGVIHFLHVTLIKKDALRIREEIRNTEFDRLFPDGMK